MKPFALKSRGATSSLNLVPVMDMMVAEPLRQTLVQAVSRGRHVVVDGSDVERIGTPCIQVLLAAANAFGEVGLNWQVTEPSPALSAAFADLGLAAELESWREQS